MTPRSERTRERTPEPVGLTVPEPSRPRGRGAHRKDSTRPAPTWRTNGTGALPGITPPALDVP